MTLVTIRSLYARPAHGAANLHGYSTLVAVAAMHSSS